MPVSAGQQYCNSHGLIDGSAARDGPSRLNCSIAASIYCCICSRWARCPGKPRWLSVLNEQGLFCQEEAWQKSAVGSRLQWPTLCAGATVPGHVHAPQVAVSRSQADAGTAGPSPKVIACTLLTSSSWLLATSAACSILAFLAHGSTGRSTPGTNSPQCALTVVHWPKILV